MAYRRFNRKLLRAGHWPVTRSNLRGLKAWEECENTLAAFNPLGTTHKMPGSTDFNEAGVQNYPSFDVGVSATLATLLNGNYPAICRTLSRGKLADGIRNSEFVREELNVWGTGGFCPAEKLGGIHRAEWA